MEIRVKEMNASDEIAIRTQSSDYSFRLTDPVQCRGVLSGGVLGSEQCDAIFVGTIEPASLEPEVARLERGSRAIFIIRRNGIDRLTTSIIQEIELTELPEPLRHGTIPPRSQLRRQSRKECRQKYFWCKAVERVRRR